MVKFRPTLKNKIVIVKKYTNKVTKWKKKQEEERERLPLYFQKTIFFPDQ